MSAEVQRDNFVTNRRVSQNGSVHDRLSSVGSCDMEAMDFPPKK